MQHFYISTKTKDLVFLLHFLPMWFGGDTKIADISQGEFEMAYRLCMRTAKVEILRRREQK